MLANVSGAMEKADPKEREEALKYTQSQQRRHKGQYEDACKFWENLCFSKSKKMVSLEDKIIALEEQIQPCKMREEELKNKLKLADETLNQYVLDNLIIRDDAAIKTQEIQQMKDKYEEQLGLTLKAQKSLADERKQKDTAIAQMKAECEATLAEQKKTAQLALNEQVRKYNTETTKLKKQLNDMKIEKETVVANLRKELEEKKVLMEKQKQAHADADFQHLLQCESLEMKLAEKENRITELRGQSKLNITVAKLKVALSAKSAVMDSKNREIEYLRKDKKDMQDKWKTEEATNAILLLKLNDLKAVNARLEDELAEETDKLKETAKDLSWSRRLNAEQADTITRLRYKVNASEPDLKKVGAKVRKLETYKLRFKEDLQTCIAVITEPKKLKNEVIRLKKRYLDNDKIDKIDQIPEGALEYQVMCLKRANDRCDKIEQNHCAELKRKEVSLHIALLKMDKTRRHFIKLLNDKILEVYELKKELEEKTKQLDKANKPAQEKVRSWVEKKVLRKGSVAPEHAEDLPNLYPDTWQLPGLQDDDIPSSSYTRNTPTSDIVCSTPVQPFVDDDGVPTIDI